MKPKYLLPFFLIFFTSKSQHISFSDGNFKNALLAADQTNYIALDSSGNRLKIDANGDGQIQTAEALQVFQLQLGMRDIYRMDEIVYFPNLTHLGCAFNNLTTLDVSSLINLESFHCNNNDLTTLHFYNLSKLTYIDCSYNDLTSLNLTGLSLLGNLSCENNFLTTLDLAPLTSLYALYCTQNYLTTLDFSVIPHTVFARCHINRLKSINMQNGFVDRIYFENNLGFTKVCGDEQERSEIQFLFDAYGYTDAEFGSGSCTLNNEDFQNEMDYVLYPNPVDAVLNLQNSSETPIISIRVYNMLGQLILTAFHPENKQIDLSNVAAGHYIVSIESDRGTSELKFIKR